MSYVIKEGWAADPSNGTEVGIYTVRSDDPDGLERTFRWYADAERYRDALNEDESTKATDDPDGYRDLNIDDQMGVR